MSALRVVLFVAGLAALAWGAVLAVDFALGSFRDAWQGVAWFVGGPVVHDLVVAPVVAAVGWLLARVLPQPWRVPVVVGVALSAILVAVAIPVLWQPVGAPVNPGLHDGDYTRGLLLALGVVWLGVLTAGLVTTVRSRNG